MYPSLTPDMEGGGVNQVIDPRTILGRVIILSWQLWVKGVEKLNAFERKKLTTGFLKRREGADKRTD